MTSHVIIPDSPQARSGIQEKASATAAGIGVVSGFRLALPGSRPGSLGRNDEEKTARSPGMTSHVVIPDSPQARSGIQEKASATVAGIGVVSGFRLALPRLKAGVAWPG